MRRRRIGAGAHRRRVSRGDPRRRRRNAAMARAAETHSAMQRRRPMRGRCRRAAAFISRTSTARQDARAAPSPQHHRGARRRSADAPYGDECSHRASSSGATSIQGLTFDLKDRKTTEREALTQAVGRRDGAGRGRPPPARASTVDRVVGSTRQSRPPGSAPDGCVPRWRSADCGAPRRRRVAEGEIEIRAEVTPARPSSSRSAR